MLRNATAPWVPRSYTSMSESPVRIIALLAAAALAQYGSASSGTTSVTEAYPLLLRASRIAGTMKGGAGTFFKLDGRGREESNRSKASIG